MSEMFRFTRASSFTRQLARRRSGSGFRTPTTRRRSWARTVVAVLIPLLLVLSGCAREPAGDPNAVVPTGEIKPRQISWLLSRPADGAVIKTMQSIAADYAKNHPGFSLRLITTPDRPSYLQKLQTLAAAKKLPEFFDIDATPFANELAQQGRMMNIQRLLQNLGVYQNYKPAALNYQRFSDKSLYMIPLQFDQEYFFYNKKLFADAGVSVPQTLGDLPQVCAQLKAHGVTPIALNGQDQWPLERYMSFHPFRTAGPDYINRLKTADASLGDSTGKAAVAWLSDLGKSGCFSQGFSATGYADAQSLFTTGKAAIYNVGTWELGNLATDALNPAIRADVDYFTLPLTDPSATQANEFVTTSGIGMAVNSATYDPLVHDFLRYALARYPQLYAQTGALSPTTNAQTRIPPNATPLYAKAVAQSNSVGPLLDVPWDTQLDPVSSTRLQSELTLLVQGNISEDSFIQSMDTVLKANAPKALKN